VLPAWLLVSRAPEMRIDHPVVEHWLDRPSDKLTTKG